MSGSVDYLGWGEVKQVYLRDRGERLLGPTRTPIDDHDEVGFRVTYLANGEIIVTLTEACGLNTVHDLCGLVADACLNGDDTIDFTRDPTEANGRLDAFEE
jgi:hypothetical protein